MESRSHRALSVEAVSDEGVVPACLQERGHSLGMRSLHVDRWPVQQRLQVHVATEFLGVERQCAPEAPLQAWEPDFDLMRGVDDVPALFGHMLAISRRDVHARGKERLAYHEAPPYPSEQERLQRVLVLVQ